MSTLFHRDSLLSFCLILIALNSISPAQENREADKATATAGAGQRTDESMTQAEPSASGPIHIVPYSPWEKPARVQRTPKTTSTNNGLAVQYWGGPVISNVQVVKVLWGNFVDSASTSDLGQFYTDITQSNYFSLLAEYGTVGLNGLGTGNPPGTNQIVGPGTFAQSVTINPSICPGGSGNPPCGITDGEIQTEITNQLNAKHLPAPTTDPASGTFNTIYMIYFPPGVTINVGRGVNSCQRGGFCAYHSNVFSGSLQVPYGVFPDFSQGGCAPGLGCGNDTPFQNLTTASSHELAEAVSDVDGGSAPNFAPPLGWADQNTGEEIGDFCVGDTTQITVNGNLYVVQGLASNMQTLAPFPNPPACVFSPAHFLVQLSTNKAVPGTQIQMIVTAQSSLGNVTLNTYSDTVHFTSTDSTAVLPADYTFVPGSDNGNHTFTLTFNSTGTQTVTVTDKLVTTMTGQASADIEHNPDMTIKSVHSGSFTQSQTGATYTLTATNSGDMPTNGTVTVADNLGFGLTPTAMSGTGWTCTVATVSCTTTNTAAAGASYPPITLTVNVANNAPPTINTLASVSGGGEANTTNDTFSDPTSVVQLPDLTISKSHVGSFAQGQFGETYTLSVSNVGFVSTTGATVTVTDTLPTGLTATAIAGTGWGCTLATLTCVRNDPLAQGNLYPPITLTVNVSTSAPMPTVTNTVTVSGGGEANTANDSASDVTTITNAAADLVIAKSHSGSFTQGQNGATYTLTVSNNGPLATDGSTVTVIDSLPAGLTAAGLNGNGWTCNASSVSCTRSDALAGNTTGTISSYPPITVTVNVAANAAAQVTNVASVSGGGEANTANDSASDPTSIIQLPDLIVSSMHFGTVQQGENGLQYALTVTNIGPGATTGATVTVTDTLPAGLTATSISGPAWTCTLSTLTCTNTQVFQAGVQFTPITLLVNVPLNAPSSITDTVTVSGGGELNTSNDTGTDTASVLPPIIFPIVTNTVSTAPGGTATYFLLVSATTSGAINLACTSGLPQGASCSFGPPSLTGPTNQTISLNIGTTFGGGASAPAAGPKPGIWPLGVYLLCALAVLDILRRSMKIARRPVTLAAGLLGLALLMSCGGGSGNPQTRNGTPPGTYVITVTGTNAGTNIQGSVQVTLIVN